MRPNYKQTPIGPVPEEWEVVELDNLVELETGKRAKGGGLPQGTVASVGGEHIDKFGNVLWNDMKFIPEFFYESLNQGKVRIRDILVVKDGATTGKVAIVSNLPYEKVAVNEHVFIIRSKAEKLLNEYLFYVLFSGIGQHQIKLRFHGMIGGVKREDMKSLQIPLPSLPEQRRIAEILSTVDEAIQRVDEVIARTERLKRGLMQRLLTRGIGQREFKFSEELGYEIPKQWEVVKLGDIGTFQYGVTASAKSEDTGVKFLRISDIRDNGAVDWSKVPHCEIDESELRKNELKVGDVLFTRIGATTGKTCFVNTLVRGVAGSYLIRFQPSGNNIDMKFLHYYTQSITYWSQVNRIKEGRLKKGLNTELLENLKLPFPSHPEQQKIAEILLTVDKKLELERKRKGKLERIKQGLMNDLLTGKKRMKIEG
jgi:type I restriction enzyme S subunit